LLPGVWRGGVPLLHELCRPGTPPVGGARRHPEHRWGSTVGRLLWLVRPGPDLSKLLDQFKSLEICPSVPLAHAQALSRLCRRHSNSCGVDIGLVGKEFVKPLSQNPATAAQTLSSSPWSSQQSCLPQESAFTEKSCREAHFQARSLSRTVSSATQFHARVLNSPNSQISLSIVVWSAVTLFGTSPSP
jgi:hypothetical protein